MVYDMSDILKNSDPMLKMCIRHGIHNPEKYLLDNPNTVLTSKKIRLISREEINSRFLKLKYL
jgi:hypothetical protein